MSTHLRVVVGAEQYAIPIANVREVNLLPAVTRIPGAGSDVLGIQSRRGDLLPVLDLRRILGISDGVATRGIIVEDAERRAILPVDAADGVEDLADAADAETGVAVLSGSVMASDRLIGVLDIAAILDRAAGGP